MTRRRRRRDTYAARLARAFTLSDFAAVFANPDQLSLFAAPMAAMRPVLNVRPVPATLDAEGEAPGGVAKPPTF